MSLYLGILTRVYDFSFPIHYSVYWDAIVEVRTNKLQLFSPLGARSRKLWPFIRGKFSSNLVMEPKLHDIHC